MYKNVSVFAEDVHFLRMQRKVFDDAHKRHLQTWPVTQRHTEKNERIKQEYFAPSVVMKAS